MSFKSHKMNYTALKQYDQSTQLKNVAPVTPVHINRKWIENFAINSLSLHQQ